MHKVFIPLGLISFVVGVSLLITMAYTVGAEQLHNSNNSHLNSHGMPFTSVLVPFPEDIPFFQALAEEQDMQLRECKSDEDCYRAFFLRGLAAVYQDQKLAAYHFRKVIAAKPHSRLATESGFWLWFLEVVNYQTKTSTSSASFTDVAKRLVREMIDRELIVHELASKLENSSVEALQVEVSKRNQTIDELTQVIDELNHQMDQLNKEATVRQALQQELKSSEKKVKELTKQLDALRRIDQELKEKTPPTRPSEKMTPAPELEKGAK